MESFRCDCGYIIRVTLRTPHAGYIVWDSDVDASIEERRKEISGFLEAIRNGHREKWMRAFYVDNTDTEWTKNTDIDVIEDVLSKHDDYTNVVLRCERCHRLHVQKAPGSGIFQTYRADET